MYDHNKNHSTVLKSNSALYSVDIIANYVVKSSKNNMLPIDDERIHSLLYYIQSRYIFINSKPIFTEDFLATEKGVYLKDIENFKENLEVDVEDFISTKDKKIIDSVLKTFQDISTFKLFHLIKEEKPWKNNYVKDEKNIIPKEEILAFFTENPKNTARLYGVYEDLEETDIINQLIQNPHKDYSKVNDFENNFKELVKETIDNYGLVEDKYHSINDVLGYVADYLIYKEITLTIEEFQILLYFIQKMFIKNLDRVCFSELMYKEKTGVSIGNIPTLFQLDNLELDKELMQEKERDFSKMERDAKTRLVRIQVLEKKANKFSKEKFEQKELQIIDTVLNELAPLKEYTKMNLIQKEKAWENTNLGEVITIKKIYESI